MCKILKLLYYQNDWSDSNQILHSDKEHQILCGSFQKLPHKSKMAEGGHLEKKINCYISATVWTIWTKFCMLAHIGPPDSKGCSKNHFKNQDGGRWSSWKSNIADRPLTRNPLYAPWLLTNRQFQWTGNGHSQLPLAELGMPSPNRPALHHWFKRESVNNFHCLTLTFDLQSQASQGRPSCQKSWSKVKRTYTHTDKRTDTHAHTWTLPTCYLPCYAVDKNAIYRLADFDEILHVFTSS